MNTDRLAHNNLPENLFEELSAAVQRPQEEAKKSLKLLLESANRDLGSQVVTILVPIDSESLQFYESTNDLFITESLPAIPVGSSIAGFVFLSGQSMGMDDARQSTHFYSQIDDRSGFTTKEYLATPIVAGSHVIGVLTAANRSQPMENPMFSGEELALADQYAKVCALIMGHENHLRRQTEATAEALRQIFHGHGHAHITQGASWMGSDYESRKEEIQAQITEAISDLSERDLEILFDLAERLSLPSGE